VNGQRVSKDRVGRDRPLKDVLALVDAALEDLRLGKPVLVADSRHRENEADFILSAQTTTVEWVAWAIRHSSGYLCAPMPAERADALSLPLMVPLSQDPRRTAYTVSVDAASGVTTGISAADRHTTLKALAKPDATSLDVIRPGHVLPLRAVPGGVLHRPGHTEACVDLCRLAGLEPVGALAELVNDDGTMMRLADAGSLADQEGLVLLTIADIIKYRRHHGDLPAETYVQPHRVTFSGEAQLPTEHGDVMVRGYRDERTGDELVALVAPTRPGIVPMVRVHSECLTGDAFGSLRCDCGPQLDSAIEAIVREGGAVVYVTGHEGRGIGIINKIQAYALQDQGRDTVDANADLGLPVDRREYGGAAAILHELGMTSIRLLTNNPAKVEGLRASGIEVLERVPHHVGGNPHNERYRQTKVDRMGHIEESDE
jgi:3,4-dihydroxy 2-butanone 4-phosphate synthase/GTP cyclohydrolase II